MSDRETGRLAAPTAKRSRKGESDKNSQLEFTISDGVCLQNGTSMSLPPEVGEDALAPPTLACPSLLGTLACVAVLEQPNHFAELSRLSEITAGASERSAAPGETDERPRAWAQQ